MQPRLVHVGAFLLLSIAIIAAFAYKMTVNELTEPAPVNQALPPANQFKPITPDMDKAILTLFQPSEEELQNRSNEDALREKFRNLYVGIYLLKTCDRNVSRYHANLSRKFNAEWSRLQKEGETSVTLYRTLQAIVEEARTSYTMLYQNTPCDRRNLIAFEHYFDQLP